MQPEESLEQRLEELEEVDSSAPEEKPKKCKSSKEELRGRLGSIGEEETSIKEEIGKIEEEERRIALIGGPVEIILEYEEQKLPDPSDPDFFRSYNEYGEKDEVIYVSTGGEKKEIFRASSEKVTAIQGMALSPDKKRLAFDCKPWHSLIILSKWADSYETRIIYIINTKGTGLKKIDDYHSSDYSPIWIDDKTLKFTGVKTTSRTKPRREFIFESDKKSKQEHVTMIEVFLYKTRINARNEAVNLEEIEKISERESV